MAHVGLHALGAFADRLGLGDSLSARIPIATERIPLHDRGKVLTHAMLMLAGAGEACSDIEHLRAQAPLFGAVASDSTTYRTFRQITPATLDGLWEAMAEVLPPAHPGGHSLTQAQAQRSPSGDGPPAT